MDIPCLWIFAAFCVLSVYQVNTSLLAPVLKLEEKILDGESTEITCSLPTNETLDVVLQIVAKVNFSECRNDKGPPPVTTCQLDATSQMHGTEVTCEAHFVAKSKTEIIYVHTDPKFTDCPEKVTWVEGHEETLKCKAEGYTPPVVHCYFNKIKVKEGEKFNVSRSMAGRQECKAVNSFDMTSTKVTVTVEYKPKILNLGAVPLPPVPEGENVTLTCEAEGIPPPTYTWEGPSAEIQTSPDNRTITIPGVKQGNYGTYVCRAQNKHGEDTQTLTIYQPVKPRIYKFEVVPPLPLSKGDNVTVTCEADGLPLPTYTWETPVSETTISPDKRIISIQGIMPAHQGNYTCIAQNTYGVDVQRMVITISGSNRGFKPETLFAKVLLMLIPASLMYCVH
ncbi:hypothetical protein XENTR_v10009985 [Xenopus tropicalis]|uniref:Intercellular adhesion molecule 5 n=1 Tax=Xenopus tropicalis TaxID=8364 RepID=A0A8J0SCE3_XENTR|nr:intercellular adhesion molecule 5 [Xenopus tropicalis]KAE8619816.1 hypothetical protein XENTR_v10009985 [Xenopus tropicalis]|eukprot:XP_012808457.1 PREDICTED: intercellular adhesion molecule 5 [Xenopus tropicalis]